jgi:hypothetical protein
VYGNSGTAVRIRPEPVYGNLRNPHLDGYGHLLPGSEDRVNAALDALAENATSPADAEVVRLDRSSDA